MSQNAQIKGADVVALSQGPPSEMVQDLTRQKNLLRLQMSDLRVRISQLQETKANAHAGLKVDQQFAQQIADLEHQHTALTIDYESVVARLASLQKPNDVTITSTAMPQQEPIIGRQEVLNIGFGVFVILLPMAIAMARRIWVRSGPAKQPILDVESSPRMQRMEAAIESIAIEVERIGEAQRFATKLLSERRPDEIAARVPLATPQRAPGTITPH